ncbi:hypothetical protein ACM64Y_15650 [Novispirillum sp. DQ9]|uniref:hypothetical protein n=1 Tax=Novispirillum sp. DQ9 TaxID=3398612 RepID=UPI003C7AB34E
MSQIPVFLALPFGLALAAAAALRLAGGADVGGRLSGAAVPAGFLAAWTWMHGLTLVPAGLTEVAVHIALGGALAGLALDAAGARPGWRALVGAAFVAAGVAAATGLVGVARPMPADGAATGMLVLTVVALGAAWVATLIRLRRLGGPGDGGEGAALLAALAGGLGLTAAAAGAPGIAAPAAALAAAALGFLAMSLPLGLPLAGGAVLGGGGALLGLAQALAVDWPGTVVPLLILGLGLFAGGTVGRLPGGPRLRPLWMLLLAFLPGLLAAATALALRG